jgi:sulfate permease
MIKVIILIGTVVFFAMNMGASGIAPTFSAVYGGRLVKKKLAVLLFTLFVLLGAITLGRAVSETISQGILPKIYLSPDVALVILLAASLSLFLANALAIPESTSMVTVGAVTGAALYFRDVQLKTFFWLIPLWIGLPVIAFILTFLLYKIIYPPRQGNLWLYEKIFSKENKLKKLAVLISCYGAFAVGTNNVANAVGPLAGAGIIGQNASLFLIAPFFGLGALTMGKRNMETFGKEVVPLGLITSNLVCLVTGSLLILASSLGAPFPYVQVSALSIFAISCVKNGHNFTLKHHITRKTFMVWTLTPLLAASVCYCLLFLLVKR